MGTCVKESFPFVTLSSNREDISIKFIMYYKMLGTKP